MNKTGHNIKCAHCGKERYFAAWEIKRNEQKKHRFFCSLHCRALAARGLVFSGKPQIDKKCSICGKIFKIWVSRTKDGKGVTCSRACAALSASKKLLKGKKRTHGAQHRFIIKILGKAKRLACVNCGRKQGSAIGEVKKMEWSNRNHLYSDDPNDYSPRCTSCHRRYDYKFNSKKIHNA